MPDWVCTVSSNQIVECSETDEVAASLRAGAKVAMKKHTCIYKGANGSQEFGCSSARVAQTTMEQLHG